MKQQKPYVIGLDLGGTNSVFGLVDHQGEIKATTSIKTQGYDLAEDYVEACVEALQPIVEQAGGIDLIQAMGIGAPNANYYMEQWSRHRISSGLTTVWCLWRNFSLTRWASLLP